MTKGGEKNENRWKKRRRVGERGKKENDGGEEEIWKKKKFSYIRATWDWPRLHH
jgi:hypothetical protein